MTKIHKLAKRLNEQTLLGDEEGIRETVRHLVKATAQRQTVWFDWGNFDPQKYEQDTPEEMNAFIDGVATAAENFGLDDYRQFDTQAEVDEFIQEECS